MNVRTEVLGSPRQLPRQFSANVQPQQFPRTSAAVRGRGRECCRGCPRLGCGSCRGCFRGLIRGSPRTFPWTSPWVYRGRVRGCVRGRCRGCFFERSRGPPRLAVMCRGYCRGPSRGDCRGNCHGWCHGPPRCCATYRVKPVKKPWKPVEDPR